MRIIIILIFSLIAGCATYEEHSTDYETLQNHPVCCSSYKELDFLPLEIGKFSTISLDETSDVYDFEGQRSYAYGATLPPDFEDQLEVESVLPPNLLFSQAYLHPVIIFLDSNFEKIRELIPQFKLVQAGFIKDHHLDGVVEIPAGSKHMVVYAASFDSQGQVLKGGTPVIVGSYVSYVESSNELYSVSVGKVRLKVKSDANK